MSAHAAAFVGALRAAFAPHHDAERAASMAAYMREIAPYLGLPSPLRAELERGVIAERAPRGEAQVIATVDALWAEPEREFQYTGLTLVRRHARRATPDFLSALDRWITTRSWWDTVDALASHGVGGVLRKHPAQFALMDAWIDDAVLWRARTALICQLRLGRATDVERLFAYCKKRMGDREFFIRKAIGWALREYSKVDGPAVEAFVEAHADGLSGLSRREALKWLARRPAA
ncbi:MAG: DNA alkylation repair protein [Myxococcales bacterium]|nr:DNA alkylation repair protein [Myxococcales bacterium]